MAKKNKSTFLKRLFGGILSRKKTDSQPEPPKKRPQSFHVEWKLASEKWKTVLLTKQVEQGLVVERSGYKVNKTNEKLFRLDGDSFSVVVATGNSLYTNKDGKVTGILFIDEGELNRAIQSDFSSIEGFLQRIDLPRAELDFQLHQERVPDWRIILEWETFWKEQLLLQISANSMALLILALGEDLKTFFESVATERQLLLVRDEYFFLNSGKTTETNYPHGKNKNIFGFGKVLREFSEKINLIKTRREIENET
ncbi:MAG: hypothetical protein O9264_18380 [Leptospira sp.]|nr:hypothetical protein [Leptospira sp.]